MRTTVSIADEVLRDARVRAAEEGRTLGELITEALRERLARRSGEQAREHFVAVTAGKGGTLPGVDITSNAAVRDLLDDDR